MRKEIGIDSFFRASSTRGSLEMAFVPAGYYEFEEEEVDGEFDFGDGYAAGVVEVVSSGGGARGSPVASLKQQGSGSLLEAGNEEDEVKGRGVDLASSSSPLKERKERKGSLSSQFSDASQTSSSSLHGKNNASSSPVKFNISSGNPESEDSVELNEEVPKVRATPKPGSRSDAALKPLGGGRGTPSCAQDKKGEGGGMRGRLAGMEMAEDMKVAVTRGNVEQVRKMLDEG